MRNLEPAVTDFGLVFSDADVLRVRDVLSGLMTRDPILDEPWSDDPGFLRALFAGLDEGWEPSPWSVKYLLTKSSMSNAADWWSFPEAFTDDANFSNARFAVLAACAHWSWMWDGFEQLSRMFAAGRADIAYLTHLPHRYTEGSAQEFALLLAHDDALAHDLAPFHRSAKLNPNRSAFASQWVYHGAVRIDHGAAVAAMDLVPQVREKLFRDRWLKAQISNAEWVDVQDLHVDLLREMYPRVWADGYEGYRTRKYQFDGIGVNSADILGLTP